MEISKGRMFRTLFKKDLMLAKNESLIILGIIALGNLFLYYKAQTSWPLEVSLGFSWVLLMFIPLSIFIRAFSSISSEWKENTVYLMMSLPVSGMLVLLSKLLSLITRLILLLIVATPFTAILFFRLPMLRMMDLNINAQFVKIAFMYATLIILGYIMYLIIAIFSVHIGKIVKKFSGVVTFLAFIVTNYVVSKILEISFNALSNGVVRVEQPGIQINHISSFEFLTASTVILLISCVIFYITSVIYERKVEL
ncbi:ABC-2 transporter permease [Serpentinicella alkaliphila]|uniref:ABC-2 family transporter n=1 Tax=Serpentinicella alkaliphila TaxID=1734049 RepID=A0A4R2SYS3_9FIRM|nr:ABC-2 transporter permease [Serpentinicella alkaliphila]QUH26524.1 ABC-2 transporter permease [Serpentinicella alkaliphila]TCP94850.1 hypothetical protein EDD79_10698 [Serpentinicella alkaliphila]